MDDFDASSELGILLIMRSPTHQLWWAFQATPLPSSSPSVFNGACACSSVSKKKSPSPQCGGGILSGPDGQLILSPLQRAQWRRGGPAYQSSDKADAREQPWLNQPVLTPQHHLSFKWVAFTCTVEKGTRHEPSLALAMSDSDVRRYIRGYKVPTCSQFNCWDWRRWYPRRWMRQASLPQSHRLCFHWRFSQNKSEIAQISIMCI